MFKHFIGVGLPSKYVESFRSRSSSLSAVTQDLQSSLGKKKFSLELNQPTDRHIFNSCLIKKNVLGLKTLAAKRRLYYSIEYVLVKRLNWSATYLQESLTLLYRISFRSEHASQLSKDSFLEADQHFFFKSVIIKVYSLCTST